MKTTARNQFPGRVSQVKEGAVNDEVELEIAGGQTIVAVVTRGSAETLGLKPGEAAFALIKASSVILVTEAEDVKFSARNQLAGVVTRVKTGAVNSEVALDIAGGGVIVAIVTNESSDNLALAVGATVTALFKASSVILGVPA